MQEDKSRNYLPQLVDITEDYPKQIQSTMDIKGNRIKISSNKLKLSFERFILRYFVLLQTQLVISFGLLNVSTLH